MVRQIPTDYQRLLWEFAAALVFAVFAMIISEVYANDCMDNVTEGSRSEISAIEFSTTELSTLAPLVTPSDDMVWRGCEIR